MFQKIDAISLAFFRMKLHTHYVAAAYSSDESAAMVRRSQHIGGVRCIKVIAM
jgi:hypothetical protein